MEETATVSLLAGVNKIKITWDRTDGANLDKMMLTGAPCNSYTLTVIKTNGGTVTVSPVRTNNKYFAGESVTLLANNLPALRFDNWAGDLSGTVNPSVVTMNSNKNTTANFTVIPTYKLNIDIIGIGEVKLSPLGGEYAANTVVTLTAVPVLGSTFTGWQGDASGTNPVTTVSMDSIKNVTALFASSFTTVAKLYSTNNSGINDYGFTDLNPLTGICYYRLRQVDADGHDTFSLLAAVNNGKSDAGLTVYPNPAKGQVVISHEQAKAGAAIKAIAADGRVISRLIVDQSSVTTAWDCSGLATGTLPVAL